MDVTVGEVPEFRVVQDLADGALQLFLELQPRMLVLAGGETPAPFYRLLAETAYPWPEVHCFFSDERCVAPDHPRSNYAMAYKTLLSRVDAKAHRMPGETCGASAYEEELKAMFGPGPPLFDLVLLGIGSDGHTASLFPGDLALEERERLVVRVDYGGESRLTLTYPALERAHCVTFLVSGESKRAVTRRVLAGEPVPASYVRAERVVILADQEAAP